MIFDTEKNMINELDDMLVAAGLEQQRQEKNCIVIASGGNKFMKKLAPARVKVKINSLQYNSAVLFVSVDYKGETCNFDLESLQPTHECVENGIPKSIKQIMKHIRATLKKHKSELALIAYDATRTRLISSTFRAEKNKIKY